MDCRRPPHPSPDERRDYEYNDEGEIYFIRPDGSTQWDDP